MGFLHLHLLYGHLVTRTAGWVEMVIASVQALTEKSVILFFLYREGLQPLSYSGAAEVPLLSMASSHSDCPQFNWLLLNTAKCEPSNVVSLQRQENQNDGDRH